VFEVTREGQIVWDDLNPYSGDEDMGPSTPPPLSLYRATRIAKDHAGLAGKEL
jgi:hypothetical protein